MCRDKLKRTDVSECQSFSFCNYVYNHILLFYLCHNIRSILLSLSLLSLNLLDVLLVLIVYCDVTVNTQTQSLTLCVHLPQDVCWCWCLLWSLLMVSNREFFICYQYKKNWFGTIFKPIYSC